MPTERRLLQWSFGVNHSSAPLVDEATGEPVMVQVDGSPVHEQVQATAAVHKLVFVDQMGSGDIITCDLPDEARATLVYQLVSDLLLDGDDNTSEDGEPRVLRLLRETHEQVLAYRAQQAAAQAGLVTAAGMPQLPGNGRDGRRLH